MKKLIASIALSAATLMSSSYAIADNTYVPSEAVKQSQADFASEGFGIFLHWGIYSMFAQGEWYLNYGINAKEYAKSASAFYPAEFNAAEWVKAIKESGAKYITFTSRHHDGFSMWGTKQSDYNIVDATPFKRDIIKELSEECQKQGIALHLYYSHIDWTREDYPSGRTGLHTGRDISKRNWPSYYKFMNNQLTELLTQYGPIRAIWFDGFWDHDHDSIPFDWQLPEQYELIHRLSPATMVANNHHEAVLPGEDIQIFERDLPGENTAGMSGQSISKLPLETCNTMNGMWGYKIADQNYKDVRTLVHQLVKARGMGANLLMNIGPQPNGRLPETALDRLAGIGEWMKTYSPTIYGVTAGDFPAQAWGTSTRKGSKLYIHILTPESADIHLPLQCKVKKATSFVDGKPVKFTKNKKEGGITLHLENIPTDIDYVVELETLNK